MHVRNGKRYKINESFTKQNVVSVQNITSNHFSQSVLSGAC